MPVSQLLNSKATIKKSTTNDIPFSSSQPVLNHYSATSSASQTVINMSFSVDQTLTDQFFLFIDGKLMTLGSSNDFTFTSVGADNTSSQVTMNSALVANLNINAYKLGLKKESEFQTDNRFTQLYAAQNSGFQGFVSQTDNVLTATTTTGTPVGGTFYSSITGRASLTDISQDLGARMGANRIMTMGALQLQNEFGPSGQPVFGIVNDVFGQVRLVGSWTTVQPSVTSSGQWVYANSNGDYLEITFYGTGLNMLGNWSGNNKNIVASVDGGSFGSNLVGNLNGVLDSRNYSNNETLPCVAGLTLGVHTVTLKINAGSTDFPLSGLEIVNANSTNVVVNAGTGYVQGKKYTSGASSLFAYNSIATGTRGGRVVIYQNGDGSIGKAWQAVNASSALLTSADHTNEEVSRTYLAREFGAGRTDDFSRVGASATTNVAFTLDDNSSTLMSSSCQFQTVNGSEGVAYGAASNSFFINFVGTGLDIQVSTTTLVGSSFTYVIDGSAPAAITFTNNAVTNVKIVSGLPYGEHVFKLTLTAITSGLFNINRFIVYQPKKPAVPSGSIELADYNVLANFSANATAGVENIATGVLRKSASRELCYTGASWSTGQTVSGGTAGSVVGFRALGAAAAQVVQHTFFGTGFDIRWSTPVATNTFTMAIDGTNPTAAGATATGFYGAITSFVASTGVVTTNGTGQFANGTWVSGLPLGIHTVTWTQNAATSYGMEAIDIITPIHSMKNNLYEDLQNTLPVGSQGISDNRKLTPVKDILPGTKAWGQAIGITSNPTTTSTSPVPMPDMSLTLKTSGGPVKMDFASAVRNATSGQNCACYFFVDGVSIGITAVATSFTGGQDCFFSNTAMVALPAGTHKFDVYWSVGGSTGTLEGVNRIFTAREQ